MFVAKKHLVEEREGADAQGPTAPARYHAEADAILHPLANL